MRYYLEIHEDGHRIPTGDGRGYETLKDAKKAAKRLVDDALPQNTVHVFADLTHGFVGGDGGTYFLDEDDW